MCSDGLELYLKSPDNSKAYQLLPPDEAAANQDDLIMWPPMVIILNTNTGKGRDGRQEGLGNKAMDNKLRGIVFSLYHFSRYLFIRCISDVSIWPWGFHLWVRGHLL